MRRVRPHQQNRDAAKSGIFRNEFPATLHPVHCWNSLISPNRCHIAASRSSTINSRPAACDWYGMKPQYNFLRAKQVNEKYGQPISFLHRCDRKKYCRAIPAPKGDSKSQESQCRHSIQNQTPKHKVQNPKSNAQSPRTKIQSPKSKSDNQNPTSPKLEHQPGNQHSATVTLLVVVLAHSDQMDINW